MSSDKNETFLTIQEEYMERMRAEQEGLLPAMQNAQTAFDILSHGKKKRAEATQLCPLCVLQGKTECPYPNGKTGCCEGYSFNLKTTADQVLDLIRS